MTTPNKIAISVGVIVLLVAVLTLFAPAHKVAPPIALSFTGVSTSSNSSSISIVVSNASEATIVYFVRDPILKSNDSWGEFPFPFGVTMAQLRPGQSVTDSVTAPSAKGEAKVPVFWGFMSSGKLTKWQQWADDAVMLLRMHDFRGRGALYTNYVEGIKLE